MFIHCFLFAVLQLHSTEMLVGEKFGAGFISIGLSPTSPYTEIFNSLIIQQMESGQLNDYDNRWLVEKCVMQHREDVLASDMITVFQVRGIFYILVVAILLSFFGLFYQVRSTFFLASYFTQN